MSRERCRPFRGGAEERICTVPTSWATVHTIGARRRGGVMTRNRSLVRGFALLATLTLAPLHASAQGRGSTPARTPDGKPDLAGIYSFSTVTPLQRPDALEGKATLADEEAAAFEAAENARLNRDLFNPEKGQPSAGYAPRAQGGVLSYNEFWSERGNKLTRDKRTSLIVESSGRTNPVHGRGATQGRGRAAAIGRRSWRLVCGPASRRPVPPRVQLRPTDDARRVQQQRANRAVAGVVG